MSEELTTEKFSALVASKATQWMLDDISKKKISTIPGYDLGNEIASAMYAIAKAKDKNNVPALQVCTQESIIGALRDMALQGLSMTRNQCYPIVYENTLKIMRSYFGTITVFERFFSDLKVAAGVIYQGDTYDYCTDAIEGYNYIQNHKSSLENRDKPIKAAYCHIIDKAKKELVYGCVMSKAEIDKSWSKAKTKNVINDFPQEMAKRTVINRGCKMYVNKASNINNEIIAAYNRTLDNEFEDETPTREATPAENNIRKTIKSRSKGNEGLKDLLDKSKAESTIVEPKEEVLEDASTLEHIQEQNNEPSEDSSVQAEENQADANSDYPQGDYEDGYDELQF